MPFLHGETTEGNDFWLGVGMLCFYVGQRGGGVMKDVIYKTTEIYGGPTAHASHGDMLFYWLEKMDSKSCLSWGGQHLLIFFFFFKKSFLLW